MQGASVLGLLFVLATVVAGQSIFNCTSRVDCGAAGNCICTNSNCICACDTKFAGTRCENAKKLYKFGYMDEMAQTGLMLLLIYVLTLVFRVVHADLLGGVLAGFLLLPVSGWVVHEAAIQTVGRIGVSLLVMEGGLGVDMKNFLKTWRLTCNLAITGTILPCLLGWGLMAAANNAKTLEGFAAGTALSSTSIGMSLMMLMQFNYLKTPLGGIIAVAAMVDDVASLVILAVLEELQDTSGTSSTEDWVWLVVKPILVSIGIICAGALLCWLVPKLYKSIEANLNVSVGKRLAQGDLASDKLEETVQEKLDYFIQVGLYLSTFGMVMAAGYAGTSYLLGAFAAGMAFSQLEHPARPGESRAESLWGSHASLAWWLACVFFATLGFSIPAADLIDASGFGLGMLYVIPAFLGKFVLGSFVPGKDGGCFTGGFTGNVDDALIVGWAMVTRGELGFLMAQSSFKAGIIQSRTYVACIWALFICTLVPPLIFGWALQRKITKQAAHTAEDQGEASAAASVNIVKKTSV